MPVVKTITYENLPEENKKDPKILPFKYIKPFKHEMEEIEAEKEKGVSAPNGSPFMFEEFLDAIKNGFKGTYEDYLDVIDRSPSDYAKTKAPGIPEGIMRIASARGDREYLITVLSRYYSPRDLYYKTIPELNDMLNMHLTESGGLM
tara:strand:- start:719 stop:1159 length:441 start_codon:yes stop_codon:yes gene_type:complete